MGGLWVGIATYPRAAAQLPGGLQGGGSPGLAVQGCGRDGTLLLLLLLLLFSVLLLRGRKRWWKRALLLRQCATVACYLYSWHQC